MRDWTMRAEPISLVRYDARWPRMFEEELSRLEPLLAPWLAGSIEHIGSTAVPGLMAKPVIDIMAPVADLTSSMDAIPAVAELDYQYSAYRPDVMHWFCKPSPERRTHHLHLVPLDSPLWADRLTFRDFLRQSPTVAAEYSSLKEHLAFRHRLDREAYTDAKTDFIREVLRRARERR